MNKLIRYSIAYYSNLNVQYVACPKCRRVTSSTYFEATQNITSVDATSQHLSLVAIVTKWK